MISKPYLISMLQVEFDKKCFCSPVRGCRQELKVWEDARWVLACRPGGRRAREAFVSELGVET